MNNLDVNTDNGNATNATPCVSGFLDFSEYFNRQAEQSEKAKSAYKSLVEDLHKNFFNPSSTLGVETKIIDVVDFIETKDLQKELNYFQKIYDDLQFESNRMRDTIEQDFQIENNNSANLAELNNRNKKIKEFESLVDKETQAVKMVLVFQSALKAKERRAERHRRKLAGAKLRMIREMRGLSQSQVANALGTNKSLISNYEAGEREPTIKNLIKLATTLKISLDWLLDVPVVNAS